MFLNREDIPIIVLRNIVIILAAYSSNGISNWIFKKYVKWKYDNDDGDDDDDS